METLGLRVFHRPTKLALEGSAFTDAAVDELSRLSALKSLTLFRTAITPRGLNRLRQALPDCQIERKS